MDIFLAGPDEAPGEEMAMGIQGARDQGSAANLTGSPAKVSMLSTRDRAHPFRKPPD